MAVQPCIEWIPIKKKNHENVKAMTMGMIKQSQSTQSKKFAMLDYQFLFKADMSKVPKKGSLLSFCKILRKSIVTVFAFYCDAKHSDTSLGSQSCLLLLVFANIPTVSILTGQSQFVVCCPSLLDWVNLYCFYISHQKNSYLHNFSSAA